MDGDGDLAPQVSRDEELPTVGTKADHRATQVDVLPNQNRLLTGVTSESEDVESQAEDNKQQSSSEVHQSTSVEPDIETLLEGIYLEGGLYELSPQLTGKLLRIKGVQSTGCCGSLFSVTDKYAVDGFGDKRLSYATKWAIWPCPYEKSEEDDRVVKISSMSRKRHYLAIRNSKLCLLYGKNNSKRQPEGTLFHLRKVENTDEQIITLESVSEPGSFVAFNEGEPCHPQTQNELARQLNLKLVNSNRFYRRMRDR